MSKTRFLIEAVIREKRPVQEVAAEHGVSRSWLYKLVARYRAEGDAAFEPRDRRPRVSPSAISAELEDLIATIRKNLTEEGFDAGPLTIQWHLGRRGFYCPSLATIWRTLKRRGLISPEPKKRPRNSYISFCAELPNECWQSDFCHWRLGNGTDVEILNFIDDHSRLCVASVALAVTTTTDVVSTLHEAASNYGLPASILTDNGRVYTARSVGGRVLFEMAVGALGIELKHGKPFHPQTQGKVERFQQTLKKYLSAQPTAASLEQLQAQIDHFVEHYNNVRPHRSLGRKTPREAYQARVKARPKGIEPDVHYRIRHDKIDKTGAVTVRYNGKLHHIGVGHRHGGKAVVMLIADRAIRIIDLKTGELIRNLTLDPSRDYQPQNQP